MNFFLNFLGFDSAPPNARAAGAAAADSWGRGALPWLQRLPRGFPGPRSALRPLAPLRGGPWPVPGPHKSLENHSAQPRLLSTEAPGRVSRHATNLAEEPFKEKRKRNTGENKGQDNGQVTSSHRAKAERSLTDVSIMAECEAFNCISQAQISRFNTVRVTRTDEAHSSGRGPFN